MDIANNGILRRLIKHLETETGQPFMLNGSSALKFLSWVGSVVNYPEINDVTLAHMQALYNVLLNTGQVDYETISFINGKDFYYKMIIIDTCFIIKDTCFIIMEQEKPSHFQPAAG